MLFQIAKFYSWLCGLCQDSFNIELRGLSFLQRLIPTDHVFTIKGRKMFFNHLSKKYFSIKDIQEILWKKYQIYRLRKDGKLDTFTEKSWNCVAIDNMSQFSDICEPLIIDA